MKENVATRRIPVYEMRSILLHAKTNIELRIEKKWGQILENIRKRDEQRSLNWSKWTFGLVKKKVRTLDEIDAWARSEKSSQGIFYGSIRFEHEWRYNSDNRRILELEALLDIAVEEKFITITCEDANTLLRYISGDLAP